MPDLVQVADQLKLVPDQALASELQNPSGLAPAYLVLGELQRRQLLRAGGGAQQRATTSVLQDTMKQLEAPRPVGPPPPPGMTPPGMGQPRTGLASMPGTTPPQNTGMPMRPMQEGGLVSDDSSGPYLNEMMLRGMYGAGDLLPGMYQAGGEVDEDDSDGSPGYAARSAPATYDPTPAEQTLLNEIARRESGGNPFARSNKSTASGMFQFINPTWKRSTAETGVGTKYPAAADAPTREQQINALHLLRQYGPNASESWAASGPYATPAAPSATPPTLLAANSPTPPPSPATAIPSAAPPPTWPAPANITFPQPPEAAALASEQQNLAALRGQAMDPQERYRRNKEAMDAQFGTFDDSTSRAGIQHLMNEAQQNLHPSISNVLLRMGLSLLAAPAMTFSQAFGRAGVEAMDAMGKQQQQARQEWTDALKLGIQLEDKQREYNYQRAQLAQSATNTQESHWQTQINQTQRQIDTLQGKLGSNKQYQQDQRFQQWNAQHPDQQLTGPFDPNFSRVEPTSQRLLMGESLPTSATQLPTRASIAMQAAGNDPRKALELMETPGKAAAVGDQLMQSAILQTARAHGINLPAGKPLQLTDLPLQFQEEAVRLNAKYKAGGVPQSIEEYLAGGQPTTASPAPAGPPHAGPLVQPAIPQETGRNESVLQNLPAGEQAIIRAMADYRYPMPAGTALRQPEWQNRVQAAMLYDPSFSASQYAIRQKLQNEFTSGKAAGSINALNTAIQHLARFEQNWQALDNYGGWLTPLNRPANWLDQMRGDPRIARFVQDQQALGDELMRTWRQVGPGSEKEVQAWKSGMDMNASPQAQAATVKEMYELVAGKLASLKNQYEQGMGRAANFHMLTPETAQRFQTHGVDFSDLDPGYAVRPGGTGQTARPPTPPNIQNAQPGIYTNKRTGEVWKKNADGSVEYTPGR